MPFYRLVTSDFGSNFSRLPEFDFCLRKNYSEPRRIFMICRFFAFCKMVRTHNLKRSIASRFRRMFARYEQTSRAGRGARFQIHISTDKADKSCKDFCFFLPLFLSKRKRGVRIKKTEALETSVELSMSQAKQPALY